MQSFEEERFAQLLEDVRPRLKRLLASYLIPPQDCEDLLQEAFLAFWRKHLQVDNPAAWLLYAVRMECLRYRRRKARQIHVGVEEQVLESLAGQPETDFDLLQDLRAAIKILPPRHQTLIQLRYGSV
jgi:RNA polymerase sigma factor (sigma-70 family)